MWNKVLQYVAICLIMIVYINRGLFVSPAEINNNTQEINSAVEFLIEMITGQSNNMDEDGNSQETCNMAKIIQPVIAQQFAQSMEQFNNLPQNTVKILFPDTQNILDLLYLGKIDHPPQI